MQRDQRGWPAQPGAYYAPYGAPQAAYPGYPAWPGAQPQGASYNLPYQNQPMMAPSATALTGSLAACFSAPTMAPSASSTASRSAADVESVAVAFFNSYRNQTHEQRALEILREELPGVAVCASADVAPEIR